MSHIVHIQTEVRDPVAVSSACTRLSLPQPVQGALGPRTHEQLKSDFYAAQSEEQQTETTF